MAKYKIFSKNYLLIINLDYFYFYKIKIMKNFFNKIYIFLVLIVVNYFNVILKDFYLIKYK